MTKELKKSKKPLYVSIGIFIGLILGYFLLPGVRLWLNEAWLVLTSDNETLIKDWVSGFGWFGPLLIIIIMVAQMFLIVIPSWLLMIVAIVAYGPIVGSIIIFAAIFCASTVGYYIGHYLGTDAVMKLIGPKSEQKVTLFIERYGIWAIIITRINPLLSNDAISFMAGILKMGYRKFIAATLVGIAPLIFILAYLGQLDSGLKTGLIWVSIVSLVLFIIFVRLDKRKAKRE